MARRKSRERRVERRGAWGRVFEFIRARYLCVDPRWLGIFRIVFGSLLFLDGARRFANARAFYTNDGLLPNHFSLFRPMGAHVFSLFHAFSTMGEVSVAFVLALTCFALFTVGYKTKLFHFLSALCITSLNARNIFVENGGTVVVNILAIWTLFLPLGRRFSVDAVLASLRARNEATSDELNDRTNPAPDTTPFVSITVLALILQWSVIYFFNAVHKSGVGWHNGTTLHWFWHQDRIVTWFGVWAREHVPLWVIKVLTYGTLKVEYTLAFILLIPFMQTWTRRLALLLAAGLHGSIALSSRLGPFSYVMTMFFLLLLGDRDFELLRRWFGRASRARTVIYDADCGICLFACRLLKRLDPFERLTFVGNDERDKIPASLDNDTLERTIAVVDPRGRITLDERAIFEILRALPFGIVPGVFFRIPGLDVLLRAAYRSIARRRFDISAFFGLGVCATDGTTTVAAPRSISNDEPAQSPAVANAAGTPGTEAEAPSGTASVEPSSAPEAATEHSDENAAGPEELAAKATADADSEPPDAATEQQAERRPRRRRRAVTDEDAQGEGLRPGGRAGRRPSTPSATVRASRATLRDELLGAGVMLREVGAALLLFALGSQVLVENHAVPQSLKPARRPLWVIAIVDYPRIFQGWGMFAPEPPYDDGRIVVDGRTVDGRKLDPLTGKEPDFDPYTPTGWGHNQFWCDYHNRIRFPQHAGNRQHLREYLLNVHRFGGQPQDRLVAFDVWWVHDNSPPPGQLHGTPLPPEKLLSQGFVRDSGATPWLKGQSP